MNRSVGLAGVATSIATAIVVGCSVTIAPAGEPSPRPTVDATAAPQASPRVPGPPVAVLLVDGTAAAPGEPGSWAIGEQGSDSPWIPAVALDAVRVPGSARLSVRFAADDAIGPWQALAAPAADAYGRDSWFVGGRPETADPPLTELDLGSLPAGEWVVQVEAVFRSGGSATYYWLVAAG